MAFTDYTSPDSVRAVLGISAKEVSDTAVSDNVRLVELLEGLHRVHPELADNYLALLAAGPVRSKDQIRFCSLVEAVSAYSVALSMIPSLPMSAPQVITDGKTSVHRIVNPYEHLAGPIGDSLALMRTRLLGAYATLYPASAATAVARPARVYVLGVGLAVDPVTG